MSTQLPPRPQHSIERYKICIVKSSYNTEYTDALHKHCLNELTEILPHAEVMTYETPGSFEIPVMTQFCLNKHQANVVITLGLIIRGETAHADLIAQSITNSLQQIALTHATPVIHEVLLLNNTEQADARCHGEQLNRGREAARAAFHMLKSFNSDPEAATKPTPFKL